MDAWDLDVARLKKCCTHYVMPDGRLMPGCSYNNLYRHKDTAVFPDDAPAVRRSRSGCGASPSPTASAGCRSSDTRREDDLIHELRRLIVLAAPDPGAGAARCWGPPRRSGRSTP